ncbi:PPR: pentatricopeptide repeat domain containing protein [Nitzschia inconspicua]|uniref:PPR: pentatricopeptide repeat domain containing protein n=1 Tax=Nitzschia inconspicua TaxID=303405 RepID=A0A9K3LNA6_9STRA|nr:PPR: pentatricopeptide repeat domain containing protein [Nitzschia inconspicua]
MYGENAQRRRRRGGESMTQHRNTGGLLCLLYLFVSSSDAFLSNNSQKSCHRGILLQSTAAPLRQEASSFQSLEDFNAHLERIAEKCGSYKEPVIARAAECQKLWEEEKEHADAGSTSFQPDLSSFETMLTAWSKCTQTLAKSRRDHIELPMDSSSDGISINVYTPLDAVKRATALLLAHPEPGLSSYNIIMDAWSKSRVAEAPDANERLLRRMMEDKTVEPDTNSYNLLLDAWANSNRENSLEKVTQIYKHMENLREEGNTSVSPSIRTINAVLHAHAKHAALLTKQNDFDEAHRCAAAALEILREAQRRYEETKDPEWQPDVASYTSCIDVHSRCGSYKASRTAQDLLEELKGLYAKTNNGNYKPNFRTYTSVVTAWSRTRSDVSPKRVEELMEEMAKAPATKPNARTYTAAIQCWARARDPLKAKQVLKLLMEMREEYQKTGSKDIQPTTVTYNNAIDACARCQGNEQQKTEALKIAFAILKTVELDESCSPDNNTYSTLLRAVTFLMPSGDARNKVCLSVFDKAKKQGLVDFMAVKNLRRAVDVSTMIRALEGNADRNGSFVYPDLPPSWSRNCS